MNDEHQQQFALPGTLPSDDDSQYITADEGGKTAPVRRSRRRRSSVEREAAAGSRSVTPRQDELPKRSPRNEGTVRGEVRSSPRSRSSIGASESIASAEFSAHNASQLEPPAAYTQAELDAYSSADARNAAKQFRWSDDVGFALAEVRFCERIDYNDSNGWEHPEGDDPPPVTGCCVFQ